ncbi:MAG: radical SAM/SPASM domain-containing protein [bacterium]
MLEIIPKLPAYLFFRRFGFPGPLPLSYTISVTYRCNSRCLTCNVYERKARELTVDEYEKLFKSLGRAPYWITISGGEPFLRTDLADICARLYRICHPAIINIPTNGILCDRIPEMVKEIAGACPDSSLIINLSLDDVRERHDKIRGVPGNFDKSMKTLEAIKKIKPANVTVGIHTVISRYNVRRIPEIYKELSRLKPDSFISEIAEEREELLTMGAGITPGYDEYAPAIDFLMDRIRETRFRGISKITQAFRLQYYEMVKQYLVKKRQIFPCYAAFLSTQIAPDGDVWPCCIRADVMGNLRAHDYDFKQVWLSPEADRIRRSVKNRECACPLANAAYTNMLCRFPSLFKASRHLMGL